MSRVFANVNTDHLDVASNLGITTVPLTIAIWYKRTGAGTTTQRLVMHGTSGSTDNAWMLELQVSTDGVRAVTRTTGSSSSEKTAHTVDSVWHHDCAVISANNNRIAYLDGVAGTAETTSRTPTAGGINAFRVGNSLATAFPTDGKIAHVAIWNVALSGAEVAQLAAGDNPLTIQAANLKGYWPLDTGSTLADSSGNGNTLTATGTTADNADNPTVDPPVSVPTFSVLPTVTADTTDGHTLGYTASTASTFHVIAKAPGSSTPSPADVVAHTGAIAFASEAVTGADTTPISGLDFPNHDLHCVLTNAAGTTAVVTISNRQKLAPTGKQYSTFASVDSDTVYAGISSPAVVAGDIREVDTVMAPSGNALTVSTDGNDSFDSDGSRQSYEARIYDVSAQDWMATDGPDEYFTIWFNNQAPEFLDAETPNIYAVPLSSAMTSVDLAALVSDPEGDALTVTSGTMPTGLTLASNGTVTGTATVQGIYTVSTEWEDVPGDTLVSNVIWIVGNINVPDVEDELLSDALEALEALYFTASTSTETRSDIPAGVVISQSPTAGSSAAPFTSVALVISEAYVNRRNLTTTRREIREFGRRR